MTNEKILSAAYTAFNALNDYNGSDFIKNEKINFDTVGKIDYSKSAAMTLMLLINQLEKDIAADCMKKNGKSNVLSAMKKFQKICMKNSIKEIQRYPYHTENNHTVLLDGIMLIDIVENITGLEEKPDSVTGTYFSYEKVFENATAYDMEELQPISAADLKAYIKTEKAKGKKDITFDLFGNDCNYTLDANRLLIMIEAIPDGKIYKAGGKGSCPIAYIENSKGDRALLLPIRKR